MAGHSKWANIRYRKSGQDAKRGKLFTKFIREITVAAKEAGGDPATNPRLRAAIDKSLSGNMTRDVIDRAVKRAVGGDDVDDLEEIRYEGYGPNGVAVIVDSLTNNRNRTVGEVRHAFSKCNGNLGTAGSVSYLFTKLGQIILGNSKSNEENVDIAIEAGAEDVDLQDDGSLEVQTLPENFETVRDKLVANEAEVAYAEVTMVPSTQVELNPDDSSKVLRLIDMLEDLDDVQTVYTNADFSS